ncbi:MAG: hypothetical protein AAFQ64_01755 [Pseudomonadota bacterium]
MTNSIAFGLVLCIGGFFALDHYVFQFDAHIFAMRFLLDAISYLAVWR